jgi:hypothetical protein
MDRLRVYLEREDFTVRAWPMDFVGTSRNDPLVVAALQAGYLLLGMSVVLILATYKFAPTGR